MSLPSIRLNKIFSIVLIMTIHSGSFAQSTDLIRLWPDGVPSESRPIAADVISDDHGGDVLRIAEVTNPVLEVFEPAGGNPTGTSVIVCPGGGYHILAIDLEGYEIAAWLNGLGITAYVLHYRVPGNPGAALMDAQRAIRLVRSGAGKSHLIPQKVGIMGFSAGGSLSARASTRFSENAYKPVDKIDTVSARPDFTLLIYPAYLDEGPNRSLTPELTVTGNTPPMFLFETADDPYGNSALVMAGALRDQGVPVEMHLLPAGGHGYGVRPGNPAVAVWPDLAAGWLKKILAEKE